MNFLVDGSTFNFPLGSLLNVSVSSNSSGETQRIVLQPFEFVATNYKIFQFFHEEKTETVWAIAENPDTPNVVFVLRSSDYFQTPPEVKGRIPFEPNGPNDTTAPRASYRSLYIDQHGNIIVGWRPGPLISRDGGTTFEQLFSWMNPRFGILCPFWNITEDDDQGLMVISEYGNALNTKDTDNPDLPWFAHGSHRGTWWSTDAQRRNWTMKVVDAGRDPSDPYKFNGYFRHIHGYHINPEIKKIHHMFLGDDNDVKTDTPGYYVSQDHGSTWSTEVLRQFPIKAPKFYNGPCFVTWWPDGKAFITSDTAATGYAWWWGSGPDRWGGDSFDPQLELHGDVDGGSVYPDTPWMAVAVRMSHETYCTTASDGAEWKPEEGKKEILFRLEMNPLRTQVLAELNLQRKNDPDLKELKWLSASRHNRLPAQARYFFTSFNRRFVRDQTRISDGTYVMTCVRSGLALDVKDGSVAPGANVIQYPYGGAANQQWNLVRHPEGHYTIQSVKSELFLDVQDGSNWLIQAAASDSDSQKWLIEVNSDGSLRILNKRSGLCLEVYQGSTAWGAQIDVFAYSGAPNQKWTFRMASVVTPGAIAGGTYLLKSVQTGLLASVVGASLAPGAHIDQEQNSAQPQQQWNLAFNPAGFFTLQSVQSGLFLDVEDQSSSPGAKLVQSTWSEVDSQRWRIETNQDGSFHILNRHSGLCVEVYEGSKTPGALIDQYQYQNAPNQNWILVPFAVP